MIISKRIKVPRENYSSDQLLDYIQEYFRSNVNGKVLRFAIVDVSRKDLVVDVSMRTESDAPKSKGNR